MLIIATVGLNSLSETKINKILLAGANVIRYNFAHRLISENLEYVKLGRRIIDDLNAHVRIMIDLPTNKVRLGNFDSIFYSVREGQELKFRSAPYSPDCDEFVPVETEHVGARVNVNQIITIGDGEVAFQIIQIVDKENIQVRALNNGIVKTMRTFNANLYYDDKTYIKYCKNIFDRVLMVDPNFVVISYINKQLTENMVAALKLDGGLYQKLAIKIEANISTQEIEYLFQHQLFQTIIVDLGEIGVNMPFAKMGNLYRQIIDVGKKYKKPVFVMTQLLESTVNNYIPSRAEILNLTNIIHDGVKGIILGHETALGGRPAYTIAVAKSIIKEVEG